MAGDAHAEEVARTAALRQWVSIYCKGFAMGAADSIPGVSGGTIAFIVGIYERLVTAIAELDPRVLGHLPRLHRPEGRRAFIADLVAMDGPFLVVLGTGAVTALVILSRALHVALTNFRALTFAFFFGLIAASVVIFYDQFTLDSPIRIGAAVAGFALAFWVSGVSASTVPNSLLVVFVAAAVAICATILPGISGAFLLLLFGQYDFLIGTLSTFVDAALGLVVGGGSVGTLLDTGTVVVVFGAGAAVGLLSVARVIRFALDRYRIATLAFLVSLMLGALRLPAEEVLKHTVAFDAPTVASLVGVALIGAGAVLALERSTGSLDY